MLSEKLKQALQHTNEIIINELEIWLPQTPAPENKLNQAMRYATLNGGKRLRPLLVLESAKICNAPEEQAKKVAVAVEMLHCYSLIHDDLPAMDDDELRRGKPTCHIQFDEATAILAGDALLTKAFEILSHPQTHPSAEIRCHLITALAKASGHQGMCAGQMLDMIGTTHQTTAEDITRLEHLKTGCLIEYAAQAGSILAHAPEEKRSALQAYAHDLGLAFQMTDDILDVTGTPEETGKKTKKDQAKNKVTFITLLGLKDMKEHVKLLIEQAIQHLHIFGSEADVLRNLAQFVLDRKY